MTSVFAADGSDGSHSFSDLSDRLIEDLGPGWTASRAYIDELGVDPAHTTLVDGFNAGATLVNYVGHSSAMSWTYEGLFAPQDALALTNEGQPSVVLQWGCWNGYHSAPEYDTLAHSLLVGGTAGAAAVLGASTLTEASADEALALELYSKWVEPGETLGRALVRAKKALAQKGGYDDVITGMTILGDPALVVHR